ncbi:MAG TPA: recombinase family protein [Spirochaetaceae bacterium]|nr:recombinase family protein [Spirochaetaceae bacterium]
MQNRTVKVIPATSPLISGERGTSAIKRRVAGYARVSTDNDDQFTSYQAQIDYYSIYIKSRPDWEFVKVYTDEGITGTNTKHREGFKSMIKDALDGKIDLIITKSVSRFARNTVDSLTTIRKLKEKKIECFFEKENIWTFDGKGELLITIMSSLAQEESRSISENCTWGQRKRFADGKVCVPYSRFLGYDRGENGGLVVNREEAKTVRLIYSMFLDGKCVHRIADELTSVGIKTPGGKDRWNQRTVRAILTNEKYIGDALLQKSFTVDYLTKKKKMNEGEIPQYYVRDDHEPIIPRDVFELVQQKLKDSKGKSISNAHPFSGKIYCGKCGSVFGSKVWHSTDKYRTIIWQCNGKYSGDGKCQSRHVTEAEIREAFIRELNALLENEIRDTEEIISSEIFDTSPLEAKAEDLSKALDGINEKVQNEIRINASITQDQDEYEKRYNALCDDYEKTKEKLDAVLSEISDLKSRKLKSERFFKELKEIKSPVSEFDEKAFERLVERIVIRDDGIEVVWKE